MWSNVGVDDDDKTDIVVDKNFQIEKPPQPKDIVSVLTTTNILPKPSSSSSTSTPHTTTSYLPAVPALLASNESHHAQEQSQYLQYRHEEPKPIWYEEKRRHNDHNTYTPQRHKISTQADTVAVVAAAVTAAQQQLQPKNKLFGSLRQKLIAAIAAIICFIIIGTFVSIYAPFKKYKIHQHLKEFMRKISITPM